jgi:UDP-glucose 4-epimerase
VWKDRRTLVTGGASFIGSHLVDTLIAKGAVVTVADDFSSGRIENLQHQLKKVRSNVWSSDNLEVRRGDLKDRSFTESVMRNTDVVFHLAAQHGGRGYIDTHPAECCTNMTIDQLVFEEAHKARVERICFASSACVYPAYLQEEAGSSYLLKEEDADPFLRDRALADLEYGWAKLMGEMALRAYHKEYGMKTASVRIFTAYGPRENETHAIIALIAKAFIRMNPYVMWGTGEQDRNFTYVQDIVDALALAADRIDDGSAINAGREDRITLNQAAEIIFDIVGWKPEAVEHDVSKPQGVASRAADMTKARKVLGWEPQISYRIGFENTIKWYFAANDKERIAKHLDRLLFERSG